MAAAGYAVLAGYAGSARRWPSRCMTCSRDSTPSLANVRNGHRCRWCVNPKGVCTIESCGKPAKAHGYCSMHYTRWRNHGDPHFAKKVAAYAEGAQCLVEGCSSPVMGRGWCSAHWQRWQNHGDPLAGKASPRVRRAKDNEDGTRTCLDCARTKPLDDFPKDRNATRGRRANCKPCHTARTRAWYAKNREEHLPRQRARYQRDIELIRERDRTRYERDKPKRLELVVEAVHRRRALLAQVQSDKGITVRKLRARHGNLCHFCKVEMDFRPAQGREFNPVKATVEHLLPLTRGGHHVWENVVLACWQCNVRKNNMLAEDWAAALGVNLPDVAAPLVLFEVDEQPTTHEGPDAPVA